MYDEEIDIKNSREIESPTTDFDVTEAINFVKQDDLEKLSDDDDDYMNLSHRSIDFSQQLPKMEDKRPKSSVKRKPVSLAKSESYDGSDTETSESDTENPKKIIFNENEFNPKLYDNLDVPPDIKELFQYISRYTPQKIDMDYKLQPFIPEFIPAVGDIDAFLKVIPPEPLHERNGKEVINFINKLGLEILDEPCGEQSEPALLHMKLRSITIGPRTTGPPPSIVRSPKDIDRWINEIQIIHANQPAPNVIHNRPIPDIDQLMAEWPSEMEQAFNMIGFPSASLDCSLPFYIELVCTLLDIPLKSKTQSDYIIALYTIFNLYLSIKNPMGLYILFIFIQEAGTHSRKLAFTIPNQR